jgi:4-hydroxythreonine-4-phosphate dehydrogenase
VSVAPLAVSMGDPAGVGLEIAARTWSDRRSDAPPFFLIGDADALRRAAPRARIDVAVERIASPKEAAAAFERVLPVLHQPLAVAETPGAPKAENAGAIIDAINRAVAVVRTGEASAVVTLPIAKATLYAAGFAYP